MRFNALLTTSVALSNTVLAYPGMGKQLADINNQILARQDDTGGSDQFDSNELIGDLLTLSDKDLTPVGKNVKDIILGSGNPQSTEQYLGVPALKSAACGRDTCCVWKYIADDMVKLFKGPSGRCTKWARGAVRLGFHDAGGWSKQTAAQGLPGGADGSILLNNELTLPENNGLQDIGQKIKDLYQKWNVQQGFKSVTMADLIQMGANVATVVCPLGPRVRSFVGRKDSAVQNPRLLPSPFQSADDLIKMFEDKTIRPHGLVALLGSHTTSQQFFVNTTRAGDPQDSTPGVWDVLFYAQTQGTAPTPQRVFKFPSDVAISKHPKTQGEWQQFADPKNGQDHWNEDYAREYVRLSLLGVNNINTLTECTKVLPAATKGFKAPDQKNLDTWLNTIGSKSTVTQKIADAINNGESIVSYIINSALNKLF